MAMAMGDGHGSVIRVIQCKEHNAWPWRILPLYTKLLQEDGRSRDTEKCREAGVVRQCEPQRSYTGGE